MQYRPRQSLLSCLLLCAVGAATTLSTSGLTRELDRERRDYTDAVQAIDRGHWTEYAKLRPGLDDYPLAIYLDFFQLIGQPDKVRPAAAQRFLSRSTDTPLPNRFLSVYLREAGKAQRWQDFLQVMAIEPNSVALKCYYFRAQLAQGNKDVAWEGASRLWVQGNSLPRECDPLFDLWQSSGGLTDDMVWMRLLNSFKARQRSLLQRVATNSSAQLAPWAKNLLAVYDRPEALPELALPADSPYSPDIASHGLVHLAAYSPQNALSYWMDYRQKLQFTAEQVRNVEYAIAEQSLFSRIAEHRDWLDGALARLNDDRLVGMRLRWALSEQDWAAVEHNLPLLSASAREENVWRYWQAIVQERGGATAAAKAALEQLAGERDYYGFLAADKLGRPYSFNHDYLADDCSVTRDAAAGGATHRGTELSQQRYAGAVRVVQGVTGYGRPWPTAGPGTACLTEGLVPHGDRRGRAGRSVGRAGPAFPHTLPEYLQAACGGAAGAEHRTAGHCAPGKRLFSRRTIPGRGARPDADHARHRRIGSYLAATATPGILTCLMWTTMCRWAVPIIASCWIVSAAIVYLP